LISSPYSGTVRKEVGVRALLLIFSAVRDRFLLDKLSFRIKIPKRMEEHMRKKDILEVVKEGNTFKIQVVTPDGEVLMKGVKTFVTKANAKIAARAFAVRHDKFSFDMKICNAASDTFGSHTKACYSVSRRDD
jgi:hypothetical protein